MVLSDPAVQWAITVAASSTAPAGGDGGGETMLTTNGGGAFGDIEAFEEVVFTVVSVVEFVEEFVEAFMEESVEEFPIGEGPPAPAPAPADEPGCSISPGSTQMGAQSACGPPTGSALK
tara:strand:- start:244 stop:600 length:357 start_codon:yes stop_codon:yes gene_type:complete